MNKTFRYLSVMASALMLSGLMASCAYDSEEMPVAQQNGKRKFTLNVTTGEVGAATRAVTNVSVSGTSFDGSKNTDEKKVSSLVWSVFASETGNAKVFSKMFLPAAAAAVLHDEFDNTVETGENTTNSGERNIKAGDKVLVLSNVSGDETSGVLKSYADAATQSAFQTAPLSISQALTNGTGSIDATKLPMFGLADVVAANSDQTEFKADVTVKHMVAKVTLEQLKVNFAGTGHPNATFTPKRMFLINVPENLTLEYDGTTYAPTGLTYTTLYQGHADATTVTAYSGDDTKTYADYLSTPQFAAEKLYTSEADHDVFSTCYSLYTMPYAFSDVTVTAASANTRLVIEGVYNSDGIGDTGNDKTMYYAVSLNNGAVTGGKDYNIKPNTHYKVKVTIKGEGADAPYEAIEQYQDATANIQYVEWESEGTEVVVGPSGPKYTVDYTGIQVGSIIYADGTWTLSGYESTWAATHGDPIAVVFSTSTSAYDKTHNGFTHGYAMSLTEDGTSYKWAETLPTALIDRDVNIDNESITTSNYTQWAADLDGLKHSEAIMAKGDATAYPAVWRAHNFTPAAPKNAVNANTSDWYLPSMGQQYLWLTQLAKTWTPSALKNESATPSRYFYWEGNAVAAQNAINTYILTTLKVPAGKYTAISSSNSAGYYFWSSQERAAGFPFHLPFTADGNLFLGGGSAATVEYRVRPVLAL